MAEQYNMIRAKIDILLSETLRFRNYLFGAWTQRKIIPAAQKLNIQIYSKCRPQQGNEHFPIG